MTNGRENLPPITLTLGDFERLDRLAAAAADRFPRAAHFLGREIERANLVEPTEAPKGLVGMGTTLEYRDDTTGQVRTVTLVYPDEADLAAGKISVLSPIGAALIGLSVGQSIEWQSPAGGLRSLTVLQVKEKEDALGPMAPVAVANPGIP
jgi:regulator of nucleoside diphosphate kinase